MTTTLLDAMDLAETDVMLRAVSQRRRAIKSPPTYGEYWDAVIPRDYTTPRHLDPLHRALQRVADGQCRRLICVMPPRHSKSTSVSQVFPPYLLGRFPRADVVLASYALNLAAEHAGKAKLIAASDAHETMFPGVFPRRLQRLAATEWKTLEGGGFYAVGVGGAITGRGADFLILDDLIKDRADADSETVRKTTIDWLRGTAYTRLSPTGAIILMGTRWHVEDPIGWALQQMAEGGEQWEVIHMAASPERPLWPERFGAEQLRSIFTVAGPFESAAQYLGEPTVRGGNRFKVDRDDEQGRPGIQLHDNDKVWPAGPWVRFWDLAASAKQRDKDDPDWTVGIQGCVTWRDGAPVLWARDCQAIQGEATERNQLILETAQRDGAAVKQGIETVAGFKDAFTTIRDLLHGKSTVEQVTVTRDKSVNAGELEPVVVAGNCHVLRDRWTERLLQELRQFPRGAHDDFANALWGAFLLARGPEGHRRVFDATSVAGAIIMPADRAPQPEPHSRVLAGLSVSAIEGHRLVVMARTGAEAVIYHVERIEGDAAEIASRICRLKQGRLTCFISVLDGSDVDGVKRELRTAGVVARDGYSETMGVAAVQQMLDAGRLKFYPFPDFRNAVEQFHRRRARTDGPTQEFVWTGDFGWVRALFDLAQAARYLADVRPPAPKRHDELPGDKPRKVEAPGKGIFW